MWLKSAGATRTANGVGYGLVALLVLALLALATRWPVAGSPAALVEWLRSAGAMGVMVFAAAYLLATLLFLPASVLTLAAGFAYGPLLGFLIVSPSSVLAATAAAFLGRSIARPWVTRWTAENPRVAAIDRAVGDSGFVIVLLLRLSPLVPFNLLNYALGLTTVRLRDFVAASWLGMMPGTLLYVYLGSVATSVGQIAAEGRMADHEGRGWLYWVGLVATLIAVWLIGRLARRALGHRINVAPPNPAPGPSETPS